MKKLFRLFTLAALACGGPAEELGTTDNGTNVSINEDLGQATQGLVSAHMGNLQFGFRPVTEIACVVLNSTQTCIVPRQKELRFIITGGSSSQRQTVRSNVNGWYQSMVANGLSQASDGWLFSETTDINDQFLTLIIDVDTGNGFCPGTATDTQDYSCYSGSTVNLTESPGIGNYVRWVGVPVLHIDYDEIQAIAGLTSTQKSNVTRQAVWSGLDRFVGIGLVIVGDNRCNKASIITNSACFVTAPQACAANSFGDAGNQSEWWFSSADCGQ